MAHPFPIENLNMNFKLIVNESISSQQVMFSNKTLLICHQHILPSLIPLMLYLTENICQARNIFVLGKPYSTINNAEVDLVNMGIQVFKNDTNYKPGYYIEGINDNVSMLWKELIERDKKISFEKIIVLDEGGFLASTVPFEFRGRCVAVEQTRFGSRVKNVNVPTIQVSVSAAKLHFETTEIVEAVLRRLRKENTLKHNDHIGVIGLGFLGTCIAKKFINNGRKVIAYDINGSKKALSLGVEIVDSLESLMKKSDVVIGCSGTNSITYETLYKNKVKLLSISSGDVEFSEVIQKLNGKREKTHSDIHFDKDYQDVCILNGGFPYNFDGKFEYEEESEIMLTRLLMAIGINQAMETDCNHKNKISLNAQYQKTCTRLWEKNISQKSIDLPDDIQWWDDQSQSF